MSKERTSAELIEAVSEILVNAGTTILFLSIVVWIEYDCPIVTAWHI